MMIHQMKRRMLMMMINNSNRFVHRLSGDIIINRTAQWSATYSSISNSNRILDGVVRRIQSKHFSSSSSSLLLQQPNPRRSLEFRTIIELQQEAVLAYPDNPMLGTFKKIQQSDGTSKGSFQWITYKQFDREVQKFRNCLHRLSIGVDDKVSIISNNRVEWAVAKYAVNSLGAQLVPMYEAQSEKDWLYILEDSDTKLLIVATEAIYEKTKGYAGKVGKVERVICLDASSEEHYSYARLMSEADQDKHLVPAMSNLSPNHISIVIYTSGTTGKPKGVELSHENIVANVKGLRQLWQDDGYYGQDVTVAYLPWAHIFGLTCELHLLNSTGSARAIVPHRDLIVECISIAQPTYMVSVPALLNKVHNLVRIGDHDDNDDKDDDGHVDDDDNDNGDFMMVCYVMVLWTVLSHCLSYLNTSTHPC